MPWLPMAVLYIYIFSFNVLFVIFIILEQLVVMQFSLINKIIARNYIVAYPQGHLPVYLNNFFYGFTKTMVGGRVM